MFEIIPKTINSLPLHSLNYLFYGASGAGMIPLMEWLLDAGATVWAIDDGHQSFHDPRAQFVKSLDQVPSSCQAAVFTTRLESTHPFFAWARRQNQLVLCCARPKFLQVISRRYSLIAVTGTHGKTNTTTALSWLLDQLGFPCDYLIGGQRCDTGRYGLQKSPPAPWLMIEADESQKTLQYFHSQIAIVLNSSGDHLEFFEQSYAQYHDNIAQFIAQSSLAILDAATAKQQRWSHPNAYLIDPKGVTTPENEYLPLQVVRNASYPIITQTPHAWQFQAAGLALCHALGLPAPDPELWQYYKGVKYRLEQLLQHPVVLRDYGHHPKELLAVYDTLRQRYLEQELVLIFQPHKYTRTQRELLRFVELLRLYDKVYLLPTEPAGEKFDPEYESDCFLQYLNPLAVQYWPTWEKLSSLRPEENQVLIFQGAGQIMHRCYEWAQFFKAQVR